MQNKKQKKLYKSETYNNNNNNNNFDSTNEHLREHNRRIKVLDSSRRTSERERERKHSPKCSSTANDS